ncbi:MAG: acyl-CoA dehydrogenase, partial [Alphaproteobacteria bacterium]
MTFRAPLQSLDLALAAAGLPELIAAGYPELDLETVSAVLDSAAAFAEAELAPLNRDGDRIGARFENGVVTGAPGFAQAYQAFAAQGWNSLAADPEFGGQGLP